MEEVVVVSLQHGVAAVVETSIRNSHTRGEDIGDTTIGMVSICGQNEDTTAWQTGKIYIQPCDDVSLRTRALNVLSRDNTTRSCRRSKRQDGRTSWELLRGESPSLKQRRSSVSLESAHTLDLRKKRTEML